MIRGAKPTGLAALSRAVCCISEDFAAALLRNWWSVFRSGICRDGHEIIACGSIFRLAHKLAPDVADELVVWLNSLDSQFVEAIHAISVVSRLNLSLALRDTNRCLAPALREALSRSN